jgi:hypothetical protein
MTILKNLLASTIFFLKSNLRKELIEDSIFRILVIILTFLIGFFIFISRLYLRASIILFLDLINLIICLIFILMRLILVYKIFNEINKKFFRFNLNFSINFYYFEFSIFLNNYYLSKIFFIL